MNLKDYIIEKSKELDIDIVGFTNCEPLLNLEDYLVRREKENRQTEFEEKNIGKRIDPKLTFSNCKSIIVIGVSYNNNFHGKVDYDLKGKLSKSSWGIDYHLVLENRIKKLIVEIEKVRDFNYKYFIDTGPLIDRELAKKAGVGFYGKNCSIINEKYGSFIFIGYILSDLDIETNCGELEDNCGYCNICIKYCPTGALESPYKFNPKKCISYLTQTKGKIPYDLRDLIGNKIYGCDTCQLVCPKNKNVKIPNHIEFLPLDTKGNMDIKELLNISNKDFREKYSSMAGGWRGRNILRRNGIIVLGNMKNKDNLNILKPFLEDPSPMIREYTAWAILKIDYEIGYKLIKDTLKKEKNKGVKLELEYLIDYFNTKLFNNN